jgi:hypothetical protein
MARSVEVEQVLRLRILPIQIALILVIVASSATAVDALRSRDAALRTFARWGVIIAAVAGSGLALGTIWSLRRLAHGHARSRRERELTERRQRALEQASSELHGQLQRVNEVVERARVAVAPALAKELELETARLETVMRRVVGGSPPSGVPQIQRDTVELEALLVQVIANAQPRAADRGRRLVTYLQRPLPALAVDAPRLAAGLSEMIGRALVEHREDEVIVRASACDGGVRIEVVGTAEPPVDLVVLVETYGGVVGTQRQPYPTSWLLLPVEPALLG